MKKLFLFLALFAVPALAQITVTPEESTTPTNTIRQAQPGIPQKMEIRRAEPVKPVTAADVEPKRKSGGFFGFFRRLFGGGSSEKSAVASKPTPTPAGKPSPVQKPAGSPKATPVSKPSPTAKPAASAKPTATPEPTVTPKPVPPVKPTVTPKPSPTPEATATPKSTPSPKPVETPKSTATPTPTPSVTPKATPKHAAATPVPKPATSFETVLPPAAASNAGGDEHYSKLKQQALKAPQIIELLKKMNAQSEGGEEYKSAASEYTTALFSKMRELDPSYGDQLTRKEGAYKRRIEAGKAIIE